MVMKCKCLQYETLEDIKNRTIFEGMGNISLRREGYRVKECSYFKFPCYYVDCTQCQIHYKVLKNVIRP